MSDHPKQPRADGLSRGARGAGKPATIALGKLTPKRRDLTSLALFLRDRWDPEKTAWVLECWAAGVDPYDSVPSDPSNASSPRIHVWEYARQIGVVPISGVIRSVSEPMRAKAMTMILERMLGQPAQHVILEAALRQELAGADAEADDATRDLVEQQLRVLALLNPDMLPAASVVVDDLAQDAALADEPAEPDAIDAESVEGDPDPEAP